MKNFVDQSAEVTRLRERCMHMANLLRDVAENEAQLRHFTLGEPDNATNRALADRNTRRRELVAEIESVLNLTGDALGVDNGIS